VIPRANKITIQTKQYLIQNSLLISFMAWNSSVSIPNKVQAG